MTKSMRVTSVLLLLAALALFGVHASDVLVLTKDSFNDTVNPENLMLIEFYAPWCGHCKALAPEYEKAATALKEEGIKLAKVDCTAEADVCERFGVQGYPTMKVFRKGKDGEYKGGRKEDTIVKFMRKQALPALSVLKTADEIKSFAEKDRLVAVAYAKADSDEYKQLQSIAEKHRDDFTFAVTTDADVAAKELGVKTAPGLVVYKQFDDPKVTFTGKTFTEDDIVTFLKGESMPTMDEIVPENYLQYVQSGLPLAFFFYDNASDRKAYGQQIEKVAKSHKGKINFVYCDAQKFGAHAETLNLKLQWPAFAISEIESGLKWPLDQTKELTGDAVRTLVEGYLDKSIKPSLKSAKPPTANDGPVKVIVGDEFEKLVLDKSKDVFVEFYAPWCGHCKALAPTWEKLGESLKGNDNVVIAKMDAIENDLPPSAGFRIEGFPTIKLFKAEDNTKIEYSGDRSLEDLISFLKKNAVHNDFEVPESADEEKKEADEDKDKDAEASPAAETGDKDDETPDRDEL